MEKGLSICQEARVRGHGRPAARTQSSLDLMHVHAPHTQSLLMSSCHRRGKVFVPQQRLILVINFDLTFEGFL